VSVDAYRDGEIAIVVFSNPPLNPLSARKGIPQEIEAALRTLNEDDSVSAIVIASEGAAFCAGADISEFGEVPAEDVGPGRALNEMLDTLSKPVMAAIQGSAFGGGLELALATDYRIASPDARFAFPEITLGIIPGGGGTQRMPRLVSPAIAVPMITEGRVVSAHEARSIGLIDEMAEGDLRNAAIALARRVSGAGRRRVRDRPIDADTTKRALVVARERPVKATAQEAAKGALDSIEAGLVEGFDAGLRVEYKIFDRLMLTEQSRGLRYAFLAERAAAKVPGLEAIASPAPVRSAAVIGSGTMGTGIALAVAQAGIPMTVVDTNEAALERARTSIDRIIARNVERGRMSREAGELQRKLLRFSLNLNDVSDADFIIEAVFEDLSIKARVFESLDRIASPGAILASNTSTLDLNRIAAFTSRPDSVVGTHFFSPANVMRLLEVVRGEKTSPGTLARTMAFGKQIGKIGVVAGVCDGFIGNRMFEEYLRQAYFLLEEGAFPQQIDSTMENWGMAMGPLRTMDLAGQDIGWNIRKRRAIEQPNRPYSRIPDLLCELGRFGQKTGAGYYLYDEEGGKPKLDPEVDAVIVNESRRLGIERRKISGSEIVSRCVYALVNEGANILDEGIACRPDDIDTVWLNGYGFPRFRGGPMFFAERLGLPQVLSCIRGFEGGYQGWAWRAATLLQSAVDGNRSLRATIAGRPL
jgi:3-hydroxyacyl-CoA dehydrogenase